MDKLKERIIKDGLSIGTDRVVVDSFLNHQIDTNLMEDIGKEFYNLFKDKNVDKILTIESSGIAIASFTSIYFNHCPIIFAKKQIPNTMNSDFYFKDAKSFTKGTINRIVVSKKYLKENDNILIIDDFLAHGEAASALIDIVNSAKANIVGIGIVISKNFQGGLDILKSKGYDVKVLAPIKSLDNGKIIFE